MRIVALIAQLPRLFTSVDLLNTCFAMLVNSPSPSMQPEITRHETTLETLRKRNKITPKGPIQGHQPGTSGSLLTHIDNSESISLESFQCHSFINMILFRLYIEI